jgi:hypothetical protein
MGMDIMSGPCRAASHSNLLMNLFEHLLSPGPVLIMHNKATDRPRGKEYIVNKNPVLTRQRA